MCVSEYELTQPADLFQVCGYRIKLHFDGYSDCYDFWVNADALDIHPVGWCEKTGHKLQPPKGTAACCFVLEIQ